MWRLGIIVLILQAGVTAPCTYYLEASAAGTDPARIAGTYSDIHYVEEAGDVIGTEIVIMFSDGTYKGTVQIAEGVPGTPIPITISVSGKKISFSIPEPSPFAGQFSGEISRGMLKGNFSFKNGATEIVNLPKKTASDPKIISCELRMFEVLSA